METYRNDPFDSGQASRKGIILAVIIGFHVLLVAALNSSLSTIVTERVFGPVETTVLEEPEEQEEEPPPPPPVVETPPPFVPPPDILIADLPPATNSTAISNVTNVKAPPPPPPPKDVVRVKFKADPRLFKNNWTPAIPPSVAREAKKSGDIGTTTLVCTINPQGKCDRVDVTESSGNQRLDDVAQKHAMRYWKFTPTMEDGKPVADKYSLRIRWQVLIEKG